MSDILNALSNFRSLIDNKTGIIKSINILKNSENDPSVFLAHAEPCNTKVLNGIKASNIGAACSADLNRALVRACGESIERYCSSFFDFNSFVYAKPEELNRKNQPYVLPHDIYSFTDSQFKQEGFPFKQVDNVSLRWTEGLNYTTKEKVWLPASAVYVPYFFDTKMEPFTHMPISTGLAAGVNVDQCVRKGVMEIIERDALMLTWYFKSPSLRIDPESCIGFLPEIDHILNSQLPGGPKWYINLLTLDLEVPVISAALINDGEPPITSFGIAANSDPIYALLLALEEACLTRMLLNRCDEINTKDYIHEKFNTLRDHMIAHATSVELKNRMSFLIEGSEIVSLESILSRFHANDPVSVISKQGYSIYYKDITTRDVKDYGFCVIRTIIPELQPLDNDHKFRYLGGKRINELKSKYCISGKLNEDPHPFP